MYSVNMSDQKGGTKGHTEGSNFAYTCIWRDDFANYQTGFSRTIMGDKQKGRW